jgi:shikimate kinase
MAPRKIALIGCSGSGKSTIAKRLAGSFDVADMDQRIDTHKVPPYEDVWSWMLEKTEGEVVLAISVHVKILECMTKDKRKGQIPEKFEQISFVYLNVSDEEKHREFLKKPTALGTYRSPAEIENIICGRRTVHDACKDLADVPLDVATTPIEEVIRSIAEMRDKITQQQAG